MLFIFSNHVSFYNLSIGRSHPKYFLLRIDYITFYIITLLNIVNCQNKFISHCPIINQGPDNDQHLIEAEHEGMKPDTSKTLKSLII